MLSIGVYLLLNTLLIMIKTLEVECACVWGEGEGVIIINFQQCLIIHGPEPDNNCTTSSGATL